MDQEERRIVLIGKTGVGKSETGNTILGNDVFTTKRSLSSVTKQTQCAEAVIEGKRVRVVDTPGFFDTKLTQDQLALQFGRSVYLSLPGVHAFILVFRFEPFTKQEVEIIKRLQEVFGEQVTDHMIILFTHAEDVGEKEIDQERDINEHLRRVIDQCGGRFHIFNNAEPQNRQQVTELLQKIDRMVQQNGGAELNNKQQGTKPPQKIDTRVQWNQGQYTNKMYEEAQGSTWEEFWEKHKSFFHIGADVLAAAVGYLVVTKDVEPVKGLMSMWIEGIIMMDSKELFPNGLVKAAATVGLAAACNIITSRKF